MTATPNTQPMRPNTRPVANHLLEVVPHVMRVIAAASVASDTVGTLTLTATQLHVLGAVKRGRRLSSEIARELRITPATATGIVDVLVRRGLLERGDHPEDRRCHPLRLTEIGCAQLEAARERALLGLENMLAHLHPSDVAKLERSLSLWRMMLRDEPASATEGGGLDPLR